MHFTNADIVIAVLAILNGATLGLYLAKRKNYNDLVTSNRFDDERRWTDEQMHSLWKHIAELEKNNGSTKSPSKKHISF